MFQFFVPVYVNGKWWCYAWDLKSSIITIIDPSVTVEKDDLVFRKHSGTIQQLSKALSSTISKLFTGWSPALTFSKLAVLRCSGFDSNRFVQQTLFAFISNCPLLFPKV